MPLISSTDDWKKMQIFRVCLHQRMNVRGDVLGRISRVDVYCGGFKKSRIGVDGLADDVIPYDSKFCGLNPRAQILSAIFRLEAGANVALLSV